MKTFLTMALNAFSAAAGAAGPFTLVSDGEEHSRLVWDYVAGCAVQIPNTNCTAVRNGVVHCLSTRV
jgi:hypothetical protein